MHQIILLVRKSRCDLQKTCLDNVGYGALKLSHRDFLTTNRAKLKQRLSILLLGFSELVEYLQHFNSDAFVLPYALRPAASDA